MLYQKSLPAHTSCNKTAASITDLVGALRMRLLFLLICFGLASCGVISERSVYEGIRSNERAKTAGSDNADKALPNYDRYSKERESIKK
jgi:hypothetical protein